VSFIGISLSQIFIAKLQTTLRLYWQSFGEVVGRIFLVVGIILISRGDYGFLPLMTIVTVASLIYSLVLWARSGTYRLQVDKNISRAILQKIWPTALAVLFNSIYLQGDRFLLPLYIPQAEVGIIPPPIGCWTF